MGSLIIVNEVDREMMRKEIALKFGAYGLHPMCIGCENGCPQANVPGLTLLVCPKNAHKYRVMIEAVEAELNGVQNERPQAA